jgi:hypothetical protein
MVSLFSASAPASPPARGLQSWFRGYFSLWFHDRVGREGITVSVPITILGHREANFQPGRLPEIALAVERFIPKILLPPPGASDGPLSQRSRSYAPAGKLPNRQDLRAREEEESNQA